MGADPNGENGQRTGREKITLGDAEIEEAPGGYWVTYTKTGLRYWVENSQARDPVPERQ